MFGLCGDMGCAPSPRHLLWFLLLPDPCKALQCRPKERCKTKGKQAMCVPSLVATCWGWGDPHYHTFDGLDFDFQGTCTYTMAESCGNDARLVPFKVEGKNDLRGGVKSVSYVSLANIKVYGQQVSIHRKERGKVRVSWPKMDGKLAFSPPLFSPISSPPPSQSVHLLHHVQHLLPLQQAHQYFWLKKKKKSNWTVEF